MLVLSRKLTQALCIGESITVTVLSVDRKRVRLGISAPRESRILRSELIDRSTGGAALSIRRRVTAAQS
jgi:carbon storage regulator